jgi:hypothetical protein
LVIFYCLLPLALYCLFLAWLNGSRRAWIVPGAWDFAGVLFALAGFLIAGGPFILTSINEPWRAFWLRGLRGAPNLDADHLMTYMVLGLGYFGAVVGISIYILLRRRFSTSIYNVDADSFESVLVQVMDGLGLRWVRSGDLVCWRGHAATADDDTDWDNRSAAPVQMGIQANPDGASSKPRASSTSVEASRAEPIMQTLLLEHSPTLRHVSLHWKTVNGWPRQAIEGELNRCRGQLQARDNPVGFWMLVLATILILGTFLGLIAYLVLDVLGKLPS